MRLGWLVVTGWAGDIRERVKVVGETPKRYRIIPYGVDRIRLAGRERYLKAGESALVPKGAVALDSDGGER